MGDLLKILKQLAAFGGMLGQIPKPIKMALLYLTVFVGVMGVLHFAPVDKSTKNFLIIAIVVLGVITGAYYLWKARQEKGKSAQTARDITQHSAATPRAVSDVGQRARLDDLRKRFQGGIEAYKSRGKDLYKLPWYAIVGEPGSGKTEAIRHSNVGFPPGMQDEFQGVGGTINMNWWFTNHAVLLDTAGRLMFEEVKPGDTSEWKEFLGLLKKNRPNCPINGLFLVIPADSLIKDSADAIQQKAGKIAQQLDVIQRVLDVRFPVFVTVTKCDKINGFREFFDGLTDPQLQHQMMGWSNPDPLDEPFKPELVEQHLEEVASRLRRRRLGLLRDPVPENVDGRRTDEVDSLYALPHSLELLSSRLRRYLETIFIAGEWSAKPLFLRGIYFSSSMREGSALDAELAEAIGVGVEDLPEGKVWERERAYFLRDLFLEKVFREKGLVTRATNTRTMLRGQQVALFAFAFAALAIFAGLSWLTLTKLKSGTAAAKYWQAVKEKGWVSNYWKGSIVPMLGDGSFDYSISTNTVKVDNETLSLGEFHARLRDVADKPLKRDPLLNVMFPKLESTYNSKSHLAQRILFEAGIVTPLAEATRRKMADDAANPKAEPPFQGDALAALIQLEADVLSRGTSTNKLSTDRAAVIISRFQNYIVGRELPVDTNLAAVMAWSYTSNNACEGWASRWLKGGGTNNNLAGNTGIRSGLEIFIRGATKGVQKYEKDWDTISGLRQAARGFADAERALIDASGQSQANFLKAHDALDEARANLARTITILSGARLFTNGISLAGAMQRFQAEVTTSSGAALDRVRAVNAAALGMFPKVPLFTEIDTNLTTVQGSLSKQVAKWLESGSPRELQDLDETILKDAAFEKRSDLYSRARKLSDEKPFTNQLVGFKGGKLDEFINKRIEPLNQPVPELQIITNSSRIVQAHLRRAREIQTRAFFLAYITEAKGDLAKVNGFPISNNCRDKTLKSADLRKLGNDLTFISNDLILPLFHQTNTASIAEWKPFEDDFLLKQAMAKVLLGADLTPGGCEVFYAAATDPTNEQWRTTWRDMKLICDGAPPNDSIRTDEIDKKLGEVLVNQKLTLQLIKSVHETNSETFAVSSDEWGPLWWICKYKGERDKKNRTDWWVEIPVNPPKTPAGAVRLRIKFDGDLPGFTK